MTGLSDRGQHCIHCLIAAAPTFSIAKVAWEAFKETNSLIRAWSDDTSVAAFDADSFDEKWRDICSMSTWMVSVVEHECIRSMSLF